MKKIFLLLIIATSCTIYNIEIKYETEKETQQIYIPEFKYQEPEYMPFYYDTLNPWIEDNLIIWDTTHLDTFSHYFLSNPEDTVFFKNQ